MELRKTLSVYLPLVILLIGCRNSEKKEMNKESTNSDSYELVKDWPNLPDHFNLGNPSGLGVDTNGNIYVFHRAGREFNSLPLPEYPPLLDKTILKIDRNNGKLIDSWGDSLFIMPHGLTSGQRK